MGARHKTFITYDHQDQKEVDEFIRTYDHGRDVFIARAVGSDETTESLINSGDDDYVMRRIREKYLSDSTVTLVFVGENTWGRKFVDWELAASLRQGPVAGKPNGVLAIMSPKLTDAILPDRFVDNRQTGYAKFYPYPKNRMELAKWIDEAFQSREDEALKQAIKNGRRKLRRNLSLSQVGGRRAVRPVRGGSSQLGKKVANAVGGVTGTGASYVVKPRRPYATWEVGVES